MPAPDDSKMQISSTTFQQSASANDNSNKSTTKSSVTPSSSIRSAESRAASISTERSGSDKSYLFIGPGSVTSDPPTPISATSLSTANSKDGRRSKKCPFPGCSKVLAYKIDV